MQVYLPEPLYQELKAHRLPASELLQAAIRSEIRRRKLLAETERYLAQLVAEVGEPTAKELARAEALAGRLRRPLRRKAKRAS
jgi:post-segregation antitoxin (ccd killing protein)